jgi:uncharacterized protein
MFDLSPYRDDIERLCQTFSVKELALFGSALRTDFGVASDLDFAVRFSVGEPVACKRAYFGLHAGLEQLFGRHVDLISWDAVENPYVRASLEATKKPIYAAQG